MAPQGSIGFRWGEKGKWNLEQREGKSQQEVELQLSLLGMHDDVAEVGFPYFGGADSEHFNSVALDEILLHKLPVKRLQLADGSEALVTSVYDLQLANYGLERGLGDANCAADYDEVKAYSPAWAEQITGVSRHNIIRIAREFAENAEKTHGRSMIIVGAGVNHWYHMDMTYRGLINMLIFCGCVGQSGGGWAHYVGQEKLRPQTGWLPLAFGLDWQRPPRHMNSTSFFYNHSSQWRYETVGTDELLSPLADKSRFGGSLIDFNVRAERMGWLPSAPQLGTNPLRLAEQARAAGQSPVEFTVDSLKNGTLGFAAEQPDNPQNFPRNLFVWRSNLLGSSGKGHEYMLKYLLGTENGIQGKDLGQQGRREAAGSGMARAGRRRQAGSGGDARFPHVEHLPVLRRGAADRHLVRKRRHEHLRHAPVHPSAVGGGRSGLGFEERLGRSTRGIAKAFSEVCVGHLGQETDVVTLPIQHDSAAELAQPYGVQDWKKGECDLIPGKTAPPHHRGGTRLPGHLRTLHLAGAAAGQTGQRRQGASAGTPKPRSTSSNSLTTSRPTARRRGGRRLRAQ